MNSSDESRLPQTAPWSTPELTELDEGAGDVDFQLAGATDGYGGFTS